VILDFQMSPVYATGLRAIDRQHEELMSHIAAVTALLRGGDRVLQESAMANLLECAFAHFAYEEEELAAVGDPQLASHRDTHSRMLITLDRMVARIHGGRPARVEDTDFFSVWLSGHILGVDKRYVPLMREGKRGILENDQVLSRFPLLHPQH